MENKVYVEKKDNFWRDLLIRIALILLFVFLLIWLFPMPKLETFYDRIFADNIKIMKDAAKDYFTVERLPIEIGDTKKMTLREMIDKKMILPFLDRDGNQCDFDNSYVEVIKTDTDYMFKINLSCPTKTDYIVDYFGCYDVCEDKSCKEEKDQTIIEYQFSRDISKNIIDKYSCPNGYVLNGSSCVLKSDITDKVSAKVSCKAGFTYNKTTDLCEKSVTTSTDADKNCPTGYVYSSNSNSCLKYVVSQENPTPVCSKGTYNASTKKCDVTSSSNYTATRVCDVGVYNSSTNKCVSTGTSSYAAATSCSSGTFNSSTKKCDISNSSSYNASLVCNQGTDNGSSCTISAATNVAATPHTTSSTSTLYATANETLKWSCKIVERSKYQTETKNETYKFTYVGAETRYSCAANPTTCLTTVYKYEECTAVISGSCSDSSYTYSRSLRKCTKSVTNYSTTYSCSNGATPVGDRCPVAAVTVPKVYKCLNGGTLSGSKCLTSSTSSVNPTYSCPSGGTLSGTICTVTSSSTTNPRYTCPNGGTLNGTTCNVSGTSTQNPTFTCKNGTLIDGLCMISNVDNKAYTSSCSIGTLSGTKCLTTSTLKENVTYSCSTGYTRTGTDCVKTTTTTSVIGATPSYKQINSKEYKWSRETALSGWTRTGNTREVKVALNSK